MSTHADDVVFPEHYGKEITRDFLDSLFYTNGKANFPPELEFVKFKVIDKLLEIMERDIDTRRYIYIALISPHLSFEIACPDIIPRTGRYQGDERRVILFITKAESKENAWVNRLERTLLHELYHAYKGAIHSENLYHLESPLSFDKPSKTVTTLQTGNEKLKEIKDAIKQGDSRVISELNRADCPLREELKSYSKHFCHRRYDIALSLQQIQNSPFNKELFALLQKKKITNKELLIKPFDWLPIYVDRYDYTDDKGFLSFSGFSVSNPKDIASSIVNEVKWRKERLSTLYRGLSQTAHPEWNFIKEVEAHLMEMGIPVLDILYPELMAIIREDIRASEKVYRHPEITLDMLGVNPKMLENVTVKKLLEAQPAEDEPTENTKLSTSLAHYYLVSGTQSLLAMMVLLLDQGDQNKEEQSQARSLVPQQGSTVDLQSNSYLVGGLLAVTTIGLGAIVYSMFYSPREKTQERAKEQSKEESKKKTSVPKRFV